MSSQLLTSVGLNMLKSFIISFILFIIFDIVWWGFLAKSFFKDTMGHIARMKDGSPDIFYPSGIAVYLIMSAVLTVFVILSPQSKTEFNAAIYGAFLGLGLFATFDLTNHAILKSYPIKFALVDISWGTFMCACVSFITFKFCR